ncbi:bifunctional glutamate N-acetyltransferase/amino-acid acetyltransferase ArgJ [Marinomonas sp. 15G1-11]|uniref:Arginine biosynthesis bifunctional protein ArgJ n=1 Tax=Marinomonas phaeophyticola TaxID=3004091 RepID=A0ABT4JZZ2_9GAMM|nr:bifunctional glutamate N-acetyltransferase/amino-acid acetyltransferase ArgJ [Marinomonas sp. 15G1-11]MCZ2723104.1 bifunctional glutamate N-acetyltransferase/amino-acid acetyltransferase ArgJ [Marinomonas sp. 15G1-11]
MAVGESKFPEIPLINGIRIGFTKAGIKKVNRKDVVLFEVCEGASVAGVFTMNAFCAAPVTLCREHLSRASARYLLINTGNANAGTGAKGMQNAQKCCDAVANIAGVSASQVLPFSTGVIGEPLPVDKLLSALPDAFDSLDTGTWLDAGEGIMTTDTRPKGAFRVCEFEGQAFNLAGISKGAGMIRPNMATMLGFVATDIAIDETLLHALLKQVTDKSFNRITIDSDTSTNDSCILIATGKAGNKKLTDLDSEFAKYFVDQLTSIMQELAHAIVKDGEGATKFVSIEVAGAEAKEDATKVAFEIAHSPLVKTALFASDPNWGRILAVVGRVGLQTLDVSRVAIYINDVEIVKEGSRSDSYTEELGQLAMSPENINIRIDLGLGDAFDTVWTTDLSHDYVTINAEYRT